MGSRKGATGISGPKVPRKNARSSGFSVAFFFRNKKVVAYLAGGEPAFAVDFFVALV